MFQNFDLEVDKSCGGTNLPLLRRELLRRQVDAFYVTHADEYRNEYLPDCNKRLQWLTGFAGSAGMALVTGDKAAIFVDGRYTLQAREQVDERLFEFGDLIGDEPAIWIADHLRSGQQLGIDPRLHSVAHYQSLKKLCDERGVELVLLDDNPIDACWSDRPAKPLAPMQVYPMEYSGESSASKRMRLAENLGEKNISAAIITRPESVAWLFNVRGGDIPHTPLCLARTILYHDGKASLFVDKRKLSPEVLGHLGEEVDIFDEGLFDEQLDLLAVSPVKLLLDREHASARVFLALSEGQAETLLDTDPCEEPRACKNPIELANSRKAHIRDGVALTCFLAWFASEAPKGQLDEIAAAKQLEQFRMDSGELIDLSFDTISASGPHAALPHYFPTRGSNCKIPPDSIYLVDSGGQYLDGTTDVTRTVVVGTPTAEMKARFTEVLKGHIAVSRCRFPEGTTGVQIDILARHALWQSGFNFNHGTGHGVGVFLGVHEGPQSISPSPSRAAAPLREGMLVSNEPGYYRAGNYGIRIENIMRVTATEAIANGETPMHRLEPLTLAPIDLNLVDAALLTDDEKDWLNDYHRKVRDMLGPQLDDQTRQWLDRAASAID